MMSETARALSDALWRIYRRPERPISWAAAGNLPWDDPEFSRRMLREHLDESHGAASRVRRERELQIDWLWSSLNLAPGYHILDITCGPGLYAVEFAARGCQVTGIDFSPAAVAYARRLAANRGVADRCHFLEQDVRTMKVPENTFDAAMLLYGQLAVFPRHTAQELLGKAASALKAGAILCVELLDGRQVDKRNSNWWFTDDSGIWGNAPFLLLGERFWNEEEGCSLERYLVLHLESGNLDEITLCDQVYGEAEMASMMKNAGFSEVIHFSAWDGLELYDAEEWLVYLARC